MKINNSLCNFLKSKYSSNDDLGNSYFTGGTVTDITNAKQTKVQLQLVQQVFTETTEAIIVLDDKQNVLTSNRAFIELGGFEERDISAATHTFLAANPDILDSNRWQGECTLECCDGSTLQVLVTATRLSCSNGKNRYMIQFSNITDLKVAEQQLKYYQQQLEKEKAEKQVLIDKLQLSHQQLIQSEKMAAVGQLAVGVAHEINSPVGYVTSNIFTLGKYVRDLFELLLAYDSVDTIKTNDEQFKKIAEVRKAIDPEFLKEDTAELLSETIEGLSRIKNIVQNLQDFSRSSDEVWQYVDLHHCLDTTLNVAWNELKYKAEVIKEYGELSEVQCLPHQLNLVFMNLLLNAAQAIETQGVIRITTEQSGDQAVVRIMDTGSGISQEHIDRIFEPFYTTKQIGKGTGLGLSISDSIIQKHKGEIHVSNEPGGGTTFTVELPSKQRDAAVQ